MTLETAQPDANQTGQEAATEPTLEQRIDALIGKLNVAETIEQLSEVINGIDELGSTVSGKDVLTLARMFGRKVKMAAESQQLSNERRAVYYFLLSGLGGIMVAREIDALQNMSVDPFADDLEE